MCLVRCVAVEMGVYSKGKGFAEDRLVDQLYESGDKGKVRQTVKQCLKKTRNKDDCVNAYEGLTCADKERLYTITF